MNDLDAESLKNAFDQLFGIVSYAMQDLGYQTDKDWIEDCVSSFPHAELYEILEERGYI